MIAALDLREPGVVGPCRDRRPDGHVRRRVDRDGVDALEVLGAELGERDPGRRLGRALVAELADLLHVLREHDEAAPLDPGERLGVVALHAAVEGALAELPRLVGGGSQERRADALPPLLGQHAHHRVRAADDARLLHERVPRLAVDQQTREGILAQLLHGHGLARLHRVLDPHAELEVGVGLGAADHSSGPRSVIDPDRTRKPRLSLSAIIASLPPWVHVTISRKPASAAAASTARFSAVAIPRRRQARRTAVRPCSTVSGVGSRGTSPE